MKQLLPAAVCCLAAITCFSQNHKILSRNLPQQADKMRNACIQNFENLNF
jgi:hypothetical protein